MATQGVLGAATLKEFEDGLHGELIRPGDAGYDEARAIWNGAHDARPALIARCADASDVRHAVGFARSEGLDVAVRGGGHSIPGFSTCDGGIVIDLSPMKGIEVDAAGRTARRRGRAHLGRARRSHPGARPRRHRRPGLDHRRRRLHPGRRDRLADAQARPRLRQPPLGRGGHRRRPDPDRERDRERGSLLGPARWRRQLRHRHLVRVRPASGRPDRGRRPDLLPGRAGGGDPALLPRVRRRTSPTS